MQRIPFVEREVRRLRRTDEIEALQQELAEVRRRVQQQHEAEAQESDTGTDTATATATATGNEAGPPRTDQWCGRIMDESAAPFLSWRPPGHYYSPIPTMRDILADEDRVFTRRTRTHVDGIDINEDAQLALLAQLAPLTDGVTFNVDPGPGRRYYTDNPSYGPGDALLMQAMLRHVRPRRYLEVGSGWTTALALDTNDRWLDGRLRLTCIEPYPDDLNRLVRPGDEVEIIASRVQDVDLARFHELEAGDLLFIDCSHVVKIGSDAHHLITRVLPGVPSGVYIHIHDILWGFEYPRDWVEEGRAWSEAYLLHAFLLCNQEFEIVLFHDWLTMQRQEAMARAVPALAPGAGSGLWLRRR